MKVASVGIRGAGLSGLSVARELLRCEPDLAITIFDTRPRLPHPPRTFCFFRPRNYPPSSRKAHSWNSVIFRGRSFERRLDVSRRPYTMIEGDDFFSSILRELEEGAVQFRWDLAAVEIHGNSIEANNETIPFDVVIDAAFEAKSANSALWQSFGGVWITMEDPAFDPSAAILMDLEESSAEAPVSFLYILPTSERTALVEHTTFSPSPMAKEHHLERCFDWLERHHPGMKQPGGTEYGRIPMGLQRSLNHGRRVVGSLAGVVRPATGYAFLRAQEHAREVALHVLGRGDVPQHPYPRWLETADSLFLRALRNAPLEGRHIMERLLSHARGDSLVAFLSGDVGLLDALSVWLSVPTYTMIRSLLRV
ncbi:MAG: hypothetical protein RIS36_2379 [Pseudomonadota bacterium]